MQKHLLTYRFGKNGKKLFYGRLFSFCILFFAYAFCTNVNAQFYVGAPGTMPDGSDPRYSSLKQAADDLNLTDFRVMNEDESPASVYLYITSDLTEEAGVIFFLTNRDVENQLFSIIPLAGKHPVITFIASPDTAYDQTGLYLNGSTMLLSGITIQTDSMTTKNILPLKVLGGNGTGGSQINVVDCNIFYKCHTINGDSTHTYAAADIEGYELSLTNSYISADFPGVSPFTTGVIMSGDDAPLSNCKIKAKQTGVLYKYNGRVNYIEHCDITINQDILNIPITGINDLAGIYIDGNNIKLSENNLSKCSSAIGIMGGYRVINNMISGFYACDHISHGFIEFIGIQSGEEILNNSIFLNDMLTTKMNILYAAIDCWPITIVKDNIIVNKENKIPAYCLHIKIQPSPPPANSDFNDFYMPGDSAFTGSYLGTPAKSLAQWQTVSGQDSNSVSREVFFVSESDFHLTGASVGDSYLAGIPVEDNTRDFDGQIRNPVHPYMGADEADMPLNPIVLSAKDDEIARSFKLEQNYPNPFNPSTLIKYSLPQAGFVRLNIYNALGQKVRTLVSQNMNAGSYETVFESTGLASGIYIYRIEAGNFVSSKKMILLK